MVDEMFSLEGRVAIVTGSGTGIGRATARVLAEHGADVVLAARRAELLEQTAASIRDIGRRALVVPTDVTDSEACERLVAATIEEYGHVDVLVNNAGGGINKAPEEWTVAEWHQVIDLNLASVWFMSRLVATPMLEQGRGAIVNISSGASFLALPMVAPYGAAKAGMNSLTRSLAAAWTAGGVRVNAVACGAVKTEGYNQVDEARAAARRRGTRTRQRDRAGRPTRRDRVSGAVPRVGCVELLLGPDPLGQRRAEGPTHQLSASRPFVIGRWPRSADSRVTTMSRPKSNPRLRMPQRRRRRDGSCRARLAPDRGTGRARGRRCWGRACKGSREDSHRSPVRRRAPTTLQHDPRRTGS